MLNNFRKRLSSIIYPEGAKSSTATGSVAVALIEEEASKRNAIRDAFKKTRFCTCDKATDPLVMFREKQIAQLFESYCLRTKKTYKTIGIYIANNSRLYDTAKNGACTIRTYNKATQWFSDNWPNDLAWPADIPRPTPNNTEAARQND